MESTAGAPVAFLEIRGLTKRYGDGWELAPLNLTLGTGQVLGILGPSGCGKTTLLRLIAGLEAPDAGEIWCQGQRVDGTPAHRRGFGLMFQDYALFPHLKVAENVAFGLRMSNWVRERRDARVQEMLELVNLGGYGGRRVDTLSGGEQQRVALARSLAPSPRLLMLDEPLGALDAALRKELLREMQRLLRAVGVTAIYVTHDQEEASAIADLLFLLRDGRLAQAGSPADMVERPASAFVAAFFGLGALVSGAEVAGSGGKLLDTSIGRLRSAGTASAGLRSGATVLIRPSGIVLAESGLGAGSVQNLARATVLGSSVRADGRRLRLRLEPADGVQAAGEGDTLEMECPWPWETPRTGAVIRVTIDPAAVSLLPVG